MTATKTKRTLRDVANESGEPWFRNRLSRMVSRCNLLAEMPIEDVPSGRFLVERESVAGREEIAFCTSIVGGEVDCYKSHVKDMRASEPHQIEERKAAAIAESIEHSIARGPGPGGNGFLDSFAGEFGRARRLDLGMKSCEVADEVSRLIADVVGATHVMMSRSQYRLLALTALTGATAAYVGPPDLPKSFCGAKLILTDPEGRSMPISSGMHGRIYALNLSGYNSSVRLIQIADIEASYLGEINDAPHKVRTRWEWGVGIAAPDPGGLAALDGLGDAIKAIYPDMEDN